MSDTDEQQRRAARQEVERAINELREFHGEQRIDYVPITDKNSTPEPPVCSVCGKGTNQVRAMVAGPSAHICNECVALCQSIVAAKD